MVKIRIHGTPIDVEIAKKLIEQNFRILACSGQYPDRGESEYVRMYLDVVEKEQEK